MDFAFAAQLAVFRGCSEALVKILRGEGSVLLAAKVLVISRVLHNKLSLGSKCLSYVDAIRIRLASLRRKLLLRIDGIFQRLEMTEEALIGAMCAFSLATSSSPTDVLRHYHHIRLEALSKQAQDGKSVAVTLLQSLQYVIQTLKDTKAYIPGKLVQALQTLKSTPTFQSQDLHSLIELNLDVHERWIDEDIKIFVPYIPDVELKTAEAGRAAKDWAKQAFMSFSTILKAQLKSITDAAVITRLRKQILWSWLSTPQRSLGVDTSDVLEGLHGIFLSQITRLIWSQTKSLQKTIKAIEITLDNWRAQSSNISTLWASSISGMEMSHGGKALTELVLARFAGRNKDLEAFSIEYKAWFRGIINLEAMIKEIRETKWDDAVDDIEDDDDVLNDKQILLSEDDARSLQDELHDALQSSFTSLQDSMERFTSELDGPNRGAKAAYLLRVWRDVRDELPVSYRDPSVGVKSVLVLQEMMAGLAINPSLSASETLNMRLPNNAQLVSRSLWEGTPELPILPSSWVFRLLHDLIHSMTTLGSDIWDRQTTNILKKQLRAGLALYFTISLTSESSHNGGRIEGTTESRQQPEVNETDLTNGEVGSDNATTMKEENQDNRIQGLFDILYLNVATVQKPKTGQSKEDEMDGAIMVAEGRIDLDETCIRRIRRNAEEYWKRSSLLFALMD